MLANVLPLLSISLLNRVISREKLNSLETPLRQNEPTANIAIIMAESTLPLINQIDSMDFETREVKRTVMFETLRQFTLQAQAPVLNILNTFQPFVLVHSRWLENVIYVDNASLPVLQLISLLPFGIKAIREQIQNIGIIKPLNEQVGSPAPTFNNPTWGVSKVNAPSIWEFANGTGVIVATIDSGCMMHETLVKRQVEGGWHDPTLQFPETNDLQGHGTHVMGTITGANGCGVAPGANWMACRGCEGMSCSETALTGCGQWYIQCDKSSCNPFPDVISCSWGGSNKNNENFYDVYIRGWRIFGIVPVFANGNSGPGCSTTGYPASNPEVISVGATDTIDNCADFSSRGPTFGDFDQPAPLVCAPGVNVVSADFKTANTYKSMSGTSMATPHVSGVIACLISACPVLRGNPDLILAALEQSCIREIGNTKSCGTSDLGNACGSGRIDAAAALEWLVVNGAC